MATRKPAAPESPARYEEGSRYAARLSRIARIGGIRLLPRNDHELTGEALNRLVEAEGADIVASAEKL